MIFSKGKVRNLPQILMDGEILEVVYSYCYLGIKFNYDGKFREAQRDLYDKGSRAMFSLLAKCRKLNFPMDIQLKLFDSVIKPIVLYACEIWGHDNLGLADKLQLRFIKMSLGVNSRTPTIMVRGETGSYPLEIDIKMRLLNF